MIGRSSSFFECAEAFARNYGNYRQDKDNFPAYQAQSTEVDARAFQYVITFGLYGLTPDAYDQLAADTQKFWYPE